MCAVFQAVVGGFESRTGYYEKILVHGVFGHTPVWMWPTDWPGGDQRQWYHTVRGGERLLSRQRVVFVRLEDRREEAQVLDEQLPAHSDRGEMMDDISLQELIAERDEIKTRLL